jgi:hypothetical protein
MVEWHMSIIPTNRETVCTICMYSQRVRIHKSTKAKHKYQQQQTKYEPPTLETNPFEIYRNIVYLSCHRDNQSSRII